MESLFESGRIVDLILALMALEALALLALAVIWRHRLPDCWKQRLPVAGLLLNLAAGACLLLALRAVLTDAGWRLAGAWLTAALLAHVGDLAQRLRRPNPASS